MNSSGGDWNSGIFVVSLESSLNECGHHCIRTHANGAAVKKIDQVLDQLSTLN